MGYDAAYNGNDCIWEVHGHTKGPWVIKTRTIETPNLPVKSYEKMGVFAASQTDQMTGDEVRIADLAYCCPTFAEIEANAHLIAAAPNILEALQHPLILEMASYWVANSPRFDDDVFTQWQSKREQAISKAKGEQH